MPSPGGFKAKIEKLRRNQPWLDRMVRTQEHYSLVQGNQQAGAVTYFGFLSVFPILALAIFVVGWISKVAPDAKVTLAKAINEVMPGLIGDGEGQLSLSSVERFSGTAAVLGVLGVLYAGLGWLTSLRSAFAAVFETPPKERPNFIFGKLRDLVMLAILGAVLMVSVAITGVVTGFSADVLEWLGFSDDLGWVVQIIGVIVGLAASALLFFALFVLLGEPQTSRRSLWAGAFLGAVGFEILKQLSSVLLEFTKGQPAFQAFGIALILLVWINYFSRVILYAASFAHVARTPSVEPGAPASVSKPTHNVSETRRVGLDKESLGRHESGSTIGKVGVVIAAVAVASRLVRRRK